MQSKLEERYENFWNNLLSQNNDNIWGRNKLRSYRKLKANFEAEIYLNFSISDISGKEGYN
jgi:2-hydroxy-3-keto-5-methylthiopentenyl-1-phosphate phosphatase